VITSTHSLLELIYFLFKELDKRILTPFTSKTTCQLIIHGEIVMLGVLTSKPYKLLIGPLELV
jgi:hypothetical protein